MILLIHICSALLSLVATSLTFIMPSPLTFRLSYGLVGSTILSGSYLIIFDHAPMLQTCETGLTYLCIVSVALVFARRRYAAIKVKNDD